MYDNILFKKRVKILRESHNMSVAQLSDVFGKSRTIFSQIELGRMKLPQDFLINLADFVAGSSVPGANVVNLNVRDNKFDEGEWLDEFEKEELLNSISR